MAASDHLRDANVIVVGAGAIGATVCYRLAQAGARVTVIERRHPGAGTTGNSLGYINGTFKAPRAYHRLNMLSIRDHEDLADELDATWVHVGGSLHWVEATDQAGLSRLRATARQLREWGMRVDVLSPRAVVDELEPDLWIDPETVPEVYRVDRAGWIDGVSMAHGLMLAATRRYGARLISSDLVALRLGRGVVTSVQLEDGTELAGDVVVNAAGPDAGRVAALAGVSLLIDRVPGVLLVSAPAPVSLGHVVYSSHGNFRPDGGARLMIQREELDSLVLDERPLAVDHPAVQDAFEASRAIMPGLRGVGLEAVRFGIRPMPRDGLPVVGFDQAVANLYHVVTHSGVTLAARLALLVTEELTGGDTTELEPYRAARLAPREGTSSGRPAFVMGE